MYECVFVYECKRTDRLGERRSGVLWKGRSGDQDRWGLIERRKGGEEGRREEERVEERVEERPCRRNSSTARSLRQ